MADFDAIAADLVDAMKAGRDDPRLQWSKDRRKVRVRTSEALPPSPCTLTATSRAERLIGDLSAALTPHGWKPGSGGWWTAPEGADDG